MRTFQTRGFKDIAESLEYDTAASYQFRIRSLGAEHIKEAFAPRQCHIDQPLIDCYNSIKCQLILINIGDI